MAMVRQDDLTTHSPFHEFVCGNCGKRMGTHWVFRPDKLADVYVGPNARKPDGKLYCHRDQLGYAASYFQRELKRTMAQDYR